MDKILLAAGRRPPFPGGSSGDWGSCVTPDGVATLNCIPIVFKNIVNWALIFSAVVAIAFIMFAGIKFLRSGGQEKLVEDARNTLTYSIIGLVVILLSFLIINFISAVTNVPCIKQFGFGNCQ